MQFDWWTFGLQVVNLLVLVWLLQRVLFKPVRKVLADRRADVDRQIAEAAEAKRAAQEEREALDAARAAFEAEKESRFAELQRELDSQREKATNAAQAEAQRMVERAQQEIERQRAEALDSLENEIAGLAADMAAKIVAGHPDAPAAAVEAFGNYVEQLSEDERRKLQLGLEEADAQIVVSTAADLDPDTQAAWERALSARFGDAIGIAFIVDPAVIGGAELRFPHAILKLSAAGALAELRDAAGQR